MKNQKGITLIALVVTIIVLLILAAVSISTLMGKNGIVNKATTAKNKTDVAKEEEMIALAANAAILEMEDADAITEDVLESELNQLIGTRDEDYTLTKTGTIFTITYINSNRSYSIEETGKVLEKIEPTSIDDWEYTIDEENKTVTINKYKGTDTEVVIPNYIEGLKVVGIDPTGTCGIWDESICVCVFMCSNYRQYEQQTITKVTVSSGIEIIGDNAFASTHNLLECNIENGVTQIGNNAFGYCSSLSDINIPKSVTSIGNYAFAYCASLSNVNIPASVTSIGANAFYSISDSAKITCDFASKPDTWNDNWTDCTNIIWTKAENK